MLIEMGSLVVITMLSWAGVNLPQLNVEVLDANEEIAAECTGFSSDQCLSSEICEVYISSTGGESCGLACDLRDAATCEIDGECQLFDGACNFPADEPAGC